MKPLIQHTLISCIAMCGLLAQASKEIRFETTTKSSVQLNGRSNINSFECEAIKLAGSGLFFPVDSLSHSVSGSAQLTVAVEDLDCKNEGMNEDLQNTLRADQYPSIHYSLDSVTNITTGPVNDEFVAQVHGNLTVSGVTKPSSIRFTIRRLDNKLFLVRGSQTIRLTDFNIEPPTVFLGLIRVKNEIVIHFDIIAKQITAETDF